MDYFGFQKELYQLKFKSRGDSSLSQRVVELYKEARPNLRSHILAEPVNIDDRWAMRRALPPSRRTAEQMVGGFMVNTISRDISSMISH
jgi:hypothetical protein